MNTNAAKDPPGPRLGSTHVDEDRCVSHGIPEQLMQKGWGASSMCVSLDHLIINNFVFMLNGRITVRVCVSACTAMESPLGVQSVCVCVCVCVSICVPCVCVCVCECECVSSGRDSGRQVHNLLMQLTSIPPPQHTHTKIATRAKHTQAGNTQRITAVPDISQIRPPLVQTRLG